MNDEIGANLERAAESLAAAKALYAAAFYGFAASRACYAAFHAATAALLRLGLRTGKHSGAIALVHQYLVKPGRLPDEHGKALSRLFELRAIADYGVTVRVQPDEALDAIQAAERLVEALSALAKELP